MKYVCAICKTEHDNIDAYLKCATNCTKKVKEEEASVKKAALEAEAKAKKEKEEKEIKELVSKICEKKQQYYSAVNELKAKYPHAFISYQFEPMMSSFTIPNKKADKVSKTEKQYIIHDDFFKALEELLK